MEFNEINALINIERENYQNDLKNGRISMISPNIVQIKQQIQAQRAERAAMEKVKRCTLMVRLAVQQLTEAMTEHANQLKETGAMF